MCVCVCVWESEGERERNTSHFLNCLLCGANELRQLAMVAFSNLMSYRFFSDKIINIKVWTSVHNTFGFPMFLLF